MISSSILEKTPDVTPGENADWDELARWLIYAVSVADIEAQHQAERAAGRPLDDTAAIAHGQAELERRRQAEGLNPDSDRPTVGAPRDGSNPVALADLLPDVLPDYSLGLSTYSRQAIAALKQGQYAASRLYDVLQHYSRQHQGRCCYTATEAGEIASQYGVSQKKVRDGLKAGPGVFWDVLADQGDKRRLIYRLRSKARVCVALGIDGPGPRVDLPNVAYTASADHYKAHVYSAFFMGNKGDYARSTLESITGATRPTLYRWERLAGIIVTTRTTEAADPTSQPEALEVAQHRRARYWLEVRQGDQPVHSAGLLDDDNQPLPDYQQRVNKARAETGVGRRRRRQQTTVWQDTNRYTPTRTKVSASGRSTHIKSEVSRTEVQHLNVSQPAPQPHGETISRFQDRRALEAYRSKHPDKPALLERPHRAARFIHSLAVLLFDGSAKQSRQLALRGC